ncbi:MAG: hypothetical protein U5K51_00375 [Flavobacteriaceae bacterium]|nr:hypothetical protein [Flavobacteriaceae bacterium]
MTHYDSAPHSASLGASDAGSGVVTILREYGHSWQQTPNPKMILSSLFQMLKK